MTEEAKHQAQSILGLSTTELAGVSPDDLTSNPVAIKMLLHYYRQLVDDNGALKNDNNTLKTYVTAYERHRTTTAVGATLLAISNVSIGFGVNLLTSDALKSPWPGISSLLVGATLVIAGILFSFRRT